MLKKPYEKITLESLEELLEDLFKDIHEESKNIRPYMHIMTVGDYLGIKDTEKEEPND